LFVRTQTNGSRTYLLIVDNQWVDGKVKQRVLLRLGRLDELLASGRLDSLIQSLGRFSEKLAVLGAHARGDTITTRCARIGPDLIFQRLLAGLLDRQSPDGLARRQALRVFRRAGHLPHRAASPLRARQ
jgi:hypothetical protein